MKKVLLLSAVLCLATTACKKDRTCTCTVPASGSIPEQKFTYTLSDTKKGKAKDACRIADDHYSLSEGSCKLD